jgi:isopentenyl-diphosphate Delta-isomerase
MTSSREAHLVELVDEAGAAIGKSTVDVAHQPPGQLHRAFSVLLLDEHGRLLLQQRAAVKTRFALRWANACCGHPLPGEPVTVAAARRLTEELGVAPVPFTELGVHVYAASDAASGRMEREYDHVLLGRVAPGTPMAPDPAEVANVDWRSPAQLTADLTQDPGRFAPWLAGVLTVWQSAR